MRRMTLLDLYLYRFTLMSWVGGSTMLEHLPEAVRKGLEEARKAALRRQGRLSVHDGDATYRIRRLWDGGFALDLAGSDRLRGHVDIYDGPRHLYQCLVVSAIEDSDERVFEFKWLTPVTDRPAPDFVNPDFVPAALLEKRG
jgi:hypothetical protein